jgi:hypothetical protein
VIQQQCHCALGAGAELLHTIDAAIPGKMAAVRYLVSNSRPTDSNSPLQEARGMVFQLHSHKGLAGRLLNLELPCRKLRSFI